MPLWKGSLHWKRKVHLKKGSERQRLCAPTYTCMDNILNDKTHLLRIVINGLPDIVSLQKPDHTVMFYNEAGYRFLNKRPDEVDGRKCYELIGRSTPCELCATRKAAISSQTETIEKYLPEYKIWLEARAIPVLGDNGDVDMIVEILREITEAKQAEEMLQKSRSDSMAILDNLPFLAWLKDSEGRFIAVNVPFARACGHSAPGDLIGKTDLDIWPKHLAESYRADDKTVMLSRTKKAVEEVISDKGVDKWYETYKAPLFDADGKVTGTTGFARDITERKLAEEALRENEERYRLLFNLESDAIVVVDVETMSNLDVNKAAEEMYGYTREELLRLKAPDLSAEPEETKSRIMNDDGHVHIALRRHRKKDGTVFPVDITARFFTFRGRPLLISAMRDITENRAAEQKILDSERRLAIASSLAHVGHWDRNLLTGELVWTDEVYRIYGYEPGEIVPSYELFISHVHPPDREKVENAIKASLREPLPYIVEFRFLRKDGTACVGRATGSGEFDRDGKAVRLSGVIYDITEIRRTEASLEELRRHNEMILNSAGEGIIGLDYDGRHTFVNPAAVRMLGYNAGELMGRTSHSIWHHTKPDGSPYSEGDCPICASLRNGAGNGTTEEMFWRKDGTSFPVVYSSNPLIEDGKTVGTVVTFRDITVQKKLEEQLRHAQKMEAVGTLAGGVAHDFNNLLMGILGYTSMLLMKAGEAHPFYEKLRIVERLAESGSELTRQLLGFARGGKYEVKPIRVNELLSETSNIFGRTRKEIAIHKKLQSGLHTIEADAGQIEQVLMNLYVNAMQAMPSGGDLYLETQNAELDQQYCAPFGIAPGAYIKITVTDTGVGMDADTRKRIFEPFFTTKEVGKGTGLGLASVYGIVRNHGGGISVDSEQGHGSKFTIFLPASAKEVAEKKPAEEELPAGNETILMVDDEPTNIDAVKELLEMIGYKVETAQSGREAIELYKLRGKKIHLVILDMIMTGMSGRETFMKLKEINAGVRVLLSSGYSLDGEAARLLDMGCRGFIQKPFRLDELSQMIISVLDMVDDR
jgi:two-component system, cell cycle sensor histidine kinase and response regulator CckA